MPSASVFWMQVRAISRKNFLVVCRNRRQLGREVIGPLAMLAILLVLKTTIPSVTVPAQPLADVDALPSVWSVAMGLNRSKLFVAHSESCTPTTACQSAVSAVTEGLRLLPSRFPSQQVVASASEASALALYQADPNHSLAVIAIDNPGQMNPALSLESGADQTGFAYRIRVDGDVLAVGASDTVHTSAIPVTDSTAKALFSVVVPLQVALTNITANSAGAAALLPDSWAMGAFPTLGSTLNTGASVLSNIAPIYLVVFFSFQVRVMLQAILEEKQARALEGMRMAGLSDAANWCGWIATAAIKNGILIIVLVAASKLGDLFPKTDAFVLLLLFLTFATTAVAFTAAVSTLFSEARTGGAVGMLFYIVLSTPSYAVAGSNVPQAAKIGVSLLAPTAFSLANNVISQAEVAGTGITWANFGDADATPVGVSMASLILMLALDTVLYVILAWYLGKVVPNEYGSTMTPFFLCTSSYWTSTLTSRPASATTAVTSLSTGGSPAAKSTAGNDDDNDADGGGAIETRASLLPPPGSAAAAAADSSDVEHGSASSHIKTEAVSDDVSSRPSLVIRGLTKTYPASSAGGNTPVKALRGLDLEFYAGQVTALLGPNGSGKSTTFQMLCGLFAPTSGEAWVLGKSILWDMGGVRASLGVCPQHDVLFQTLTVREHLELFAAIRGVQAADTAAAVASVITSVGLEAEASQLAGKLSGGQKRRLSLGMALVGDPPVLLLDEPTTGCDAAVRRKIWDLLTAQRAKGKLIVLSSHDMAECEVLADRVCILARGQLRVAGSTRFLKREFGVGYHLTTTMATTFDKASSPASPASSASASSDLLSLIREHVPLAALETEKIGRAATESSRSDAATSELAFTLPLESVGRFPALFDSLDASGGPLGVRGYGLETTSLEEAFMRLVNALEIEAQAESDAEAIAITATGDMFGAGTTSALTGAAGSATDIMGGGGAVAVTRYDGSSGVAGLSKLASAPTTSAYTKASVSASAGSAGGGGGVFGDGSSTSRVPALGDKALLPLLAPQCARQVKAVLRRRYQQTRRDVRAVWLQCLLPLVFVGISFAFSSLSGIGDVTLPEAVSFGAEPLKRGLVPQGGLVGQEQQHRTRNPVLRSSSPRTDGELRTYSALPDSLSVPFWTATDLSHHPSSLSTVASAPDIGSVSDAASLSASLNAALLAPAPAGLSGVTGSILTASNAQTAMAGTQPVSDDISPFLLGTTAQPSAGFQFAALVGLAKPNVTSADALDWTGGASASTNPTGWVAAMLFNASYGSAIPAGVQAVSNALIAHSNAAVLPLSGSLDPLPRSVTGFVPSDDLAGIGLFLTAAISSFYVALGFAIVPGLQAINVVKERESKVQAVQAVMGLRPEAYWLGFWLWDGVVMFIVPVIGTVIILALGGRYAADQLPVVALLIIVFGIACPGPAYALSFLFDTAADAQTWVMLITTASTIVTYFASFALEFPGVLPRGSPVPTVLSYTFQALLPTFGLAQGLADIANKATCKGSFAPLLPPGETCVAPSAFEWDIAGSKLVIMLVSAVLWFGIVQLIQAARDPARAPPRIDAAAYTDPPNTARLPTDPATGRPAVMEDEDVTAERRRVAALARVESVGPGDAPLVARGLRKVYFGSTRPKVAVANTSLAVAEGEIFGLLGPNGAGKTTLQSMLVGDLAASAGAATVDGRAVGQARGAAGGAGGIGYCPQFDALMPLLTGEEVLRFYCDVAGVPEDIIDEYVRNALIAVGVDEFGKRTTKGYSGGNKRKLSLAVAYASCPRVTFLDEATAGVDPVARRAVWKVIWRSRESRATVVTTHLLEEAAQLCSRIGIVVSGVMVCLGSPQHLKTRYGRGLQVDVECGDVESVRRAIASAVSQPVDAVRVFEQHGRSARLEIDVSSVQAGSSGPERIPLAALFRALLATDDVSDFAVSQPTLESIFLRFARVQQDAEEQEAAG